MSRAVGVWPTVPIDVISVIPKLGDLYLLCSDGLAGVVNDEEIVGILEAEATLDTTAWALIERANEYGGPDNVTCVLVRWVP